MRHAGKRKIKALPTCRQGCTGITGENGYPRANSLSLFTRSAIGGWVLNSFMIPPPVSGFTMNMCAVAGFASASVRLRSLFELLERVHETVGISRDLRAALVGLVFRVREMAICTSMAAMGATIIMTRATIGLPPSSSSACRSEEHRPLRHLRQHADRAGDGRHDGAGQMSRCLMCDSSWESTPPVPHGTAPQDPLSHGYDAVLRVPARGKGVESLLRDDVDLGHGRPAFWLSLRTEHTGPGPAPQ